MPNQHIALHEIELGRCRLCGWRTGGPSVCGGCIRKGTEQRIRDLEEQLEAYEDALEQIVAMRIAYGGPENEWWAIARRAVTAYDDSIPAKKPQPVRYEADGEGRLYVEYDNGEVMPTGKVSRAFAGKSNITPDRYAELFPA